LNRLAEYGHAVVGTVWLDSMPSSLLADFVRDRIGLLHNRFPSFYGYTLIFSEGIGLIPLVHIIFSFF